MKELISGSESKSNIGRNPMSLDLGLDSGDMDNVEKVQDFIRLVGELGLQICQKS